MSDRAAQDKPTGWVYVKATGVYHYFVDGVAICSSDTVSAGETEVRRANAKGNCKECMEQRKSGN